MTIGIRRLAEHLDLSIGTVSRALNGHPQVNAETRNRVIEAAAQLGYAPNQAGRSLRLGTIGSAAMVLTTDRLSAADALLFSEIACGIRDEMEDAGLDFVIHPVRGGCGMLDRIRRIVERGQAEGLIFAETQPDDARIRYLVERSFPFVIFGRSDVPGNYPWVDFNFESAMDDAVGRLADLGHRRIALICGAPGLTYDDIIRRRFAMELARRGIPLPADRIVSTTDDEAGGHAAMSRLMALPEPPTAVIIPQHRGVVGAFARLREAGLTPGRDVSFIGCAIDMPNSHFVDPPLTCFATDVTGLGRALGRALVAAIPRLAGNASPPARRTLWPWKLVARASDTAPLTE